MTQNVLIDEHQSSRQLSRHVSDDVSKTMAHHVPISSRSVNKYNPSLSESTLEPISRIDFLERNLRYIQEQQGIVLVDLHDEITRLQQENRDLHYQLIKTNSLPSRDQKLRNSGQISSSANNQIFLKQRIDRLEKQLLESEQNNKYLIYTIDELSKQSSSKSEESDIHIINKDDTQITVQMTTNEYQNPSNMSYEKEQQFMHEISKLRSVLVEILNTEQLNVSSKTLIRECLTSTNISENRMSKATTTPVDMLFYNENQQRESTTSPSGAAKNLLIRPELPVRRLNLSPPRIAAQRPLGSHRANEQRISLPPIMSRNNTTLFSDANDGNCLWYNPTNLKTDSQQQHSIKIGETPIARRERATHELQKNRLMKNLYQ
ncbi:unnamed protein product [Rotaria socialis]|uniref:CCDC92/74 N-terminal domain-containing protein n=1 Tax=Rotaria socialis TaxID=392032 RepID=A0A817TGB7_9BILA|nr:unnamed protein product [Rotaria socialis]CAF3322453.1 unnamed protein product [Rotaria socialis]CAF3466967.1 unnamed protein product [Rotaria socialis]CAF3490899.1 unnamed protein product [Rotaria socialis]CAF3518386.1 unnamed protein product [Rotaria socialis]